MIECRKCKYWKGSEHRVSCKFTDPPRKPTYFPGTNEPLPEIFGDLCNDWACIKMCHHPECFVEKIDANPVRGIYKEKIRIAGQAQFNTKNNCKYF